MLNEYRFTFMRDNAEKRDSIEAPTLEAATAAAEAFCKLNGCVIASVEWFDAEAQRWRKSAVQYA